MNENSQGEVIAELETGAPFGVRASDVERLDTHISALFLLPERVFKLKRAVTLPYVDFSDPEARRAACEAEVRLNRRTAPSIYRGTVRVTRETTGTLALDGEGETVDWLVEMRRFDQDTLFDRMAERDELTAELIETLAEEIAELHEKAEQREEAGGANGLRRVIEGNADSFDRLPDGLLDPELVNKVDAGCRSALDDLASPLDERRAAGLVRHCHGDLHLRNICLWEGRPTLFDAIEFDERLATIDVFYDIAFLLMDLEHRGLRSLANRCLNRYLEITNDYEGLAVLGLFMAVRAAIRAHVIATTAIGRENETARVREANAYLELALSFLQRTPPRLVAVGGFSGTGKTTLARAVAPDLPPPPGAVILRSDVTRKALAGAAPTERLPESAYGAEMSERVYSTLIDRARRSLEAGHSAIVDAVNARPGERAAAEQIAGELGVRFDGLWLEAPAPELEERVDTRSRDASDATSAVVRRQLEYETGEIAWRRIDTSGSVGDSAARVRRALEIDD